MYDMQAQLYTPSIVADFGSIFIRSSGECDCKTEIIQQLPAASEDTRGKLIILSKENSDIPYICLKTNGIYMGKA